MKDITDFSLQNKVENNTKEIKLIEVQKKLFNHGLEFYINLCKPKISFIFDVEIRTKGDHKGLFIYFNFIFISIDFEYYNGDHEEEE